MRFTVNMKKVYCLCLCLFLGGVAAKAAGWSQWRGPVRDGICPETGLLTAWPEKGPSLLWTANGIGRGFSAPVIGGSLIFITGDANEKLNIYAFSLAGKRKWHVTNGKLWKKSFPGARASCTYDDGRLYHMNAHGRLACLNGADGKEIWAVNVLERFEGKNITWALSESVLVDGDKVYATPGGKKGLMVALDKKTGKTIWAGDPLPGDEASYASPLLINMGGRRLLVNCSKKCVFGVNAADGKLLWTVPHGDPENSVAVTPVMWGDSVFATSASRNYGAMMRIRLGAEGKTAEKVWTKELKFSHGGLVCMDGQLYGANVASTLRGWVAVNGKDGEARSLGVKLTPGSLIGARGGYLYCLAQDGEIALLKPTATGCETLGRMKVAKGKDMWAHPVILDGRLYLRFHEKLFCYDLKK